MSLRCDQAFPRFRGFAHSLHASATASYLVIGVLSALIIIP